MSIFSALTQLSSNTVDAVMGETLRFVPRKAARNAAGGIDTSRAVAEVAGVYREIMGLTKADTSTTGKAFDHKFMTPKKTVSVDVMTWPAVAGFKSGDRIIRLDLPDQPEFEIANPPESDGRTRLVFTIGTVS